MPIFTTTLDRYNQINLLIWLKIFLVHVCKFVMKRQDQIWKCVNVFQDVLLHSRRSVLFCAMKYGMLMVQNQKFYQIDILVMQPFKNSWNPDI